jgi:N-acyl-D-aspartate/D-glutamate deacylase
MLDLVIRGGQLIDGTGAARRRADVGIRGGRVVALGSLDEPAARTIDADGAVVAPGFVDPHTHYDAQVFWDPALTPSTLHGITTMVAGNCGFSVAPLTGDSADYLMRMLARVEGMPLTSLETGVPWDWQSTGDYLDRLDGRLAPNVGFMVGHSALRRVVLGEAASEREATAPELEAMKELLRAGIAAGGLGFSSSLVQAHSDAAGDPVPSRHASFAELLELAAVCGELPGTSLEVAPYTGTPFPAEIVDLMIGMSARARRPLNWNILSVRAGNGEEVEAKLVIADQAQAAGAKVLGLAMPVTVGTRLNFASGFVLDMLPRWAKPMTLPLADKLALLSATAGRAELRASAAQDGPMRRWARWEDYVLYECFTDETARYEGQTVGAIAAAQGKDPFDALLDIAVADGLRTSFGREVGPDTAADWEARGRVLRDPRVIVGASDAGAHLDMVDTFSYTTKLHQQGVREFGVIDTEAAVHLLTQVPAELYGLRDRGVLREGAWADVVVFDEASVGCGPLHTRHDLPGGASRLFAESTGVQQVLVNGVPIVVHGQVTGELPGGVVRSGRDTRTPGLDLATPIKFSD